MLWRYLQQHRVEIKHVLKIRDKQELNKIFNNTLSGSLNDALNIKSAQNQSPKAIFKNCRYQILATM
ncbi:hypothetical protein BM607_002330 [Shewanella sp. SACH]|nr:hypothetical protein BM607_002330 [Shewanella sp. SACH]